MLTSNVFVIILFTSYSLSIFSWRTYNSNVGVKFAGIRNLKPHATSLYVKPSQIGNHEQYTVKPNEPSGMQGNNNSLRFDVLPIFELANVGKGYNLTNNELNILTKVTYNIKLRTKALLYNTKLRAEILILQSRIFLLSITSKLRQILQKLKAFFKVCTLNNL